MVKIKFYTKDGCWLCDMARDMINGRREQYDIVLEEIHIDSDDDLYELYRFDVPVLEFEDGSTLNGHIKNKHFLRSLDANKKQ